MFLENCVCLCIYNCTKYAYITQVINVTFFYHKLSYK